MRKSRLFVLCIEMFCEELCKSSFTFSPPVSCVPLLEAGFVLCHRFFTFLRQLLTVHKAAAWSYFADIVELYCAV